jgi:peptidoglycan/LPS O-acetylase OafA/YrhL
MLGRGGGGMTSKYRADIDGLRAVSVLAVMGFHFGLAAFGGGFIGVDVFFVISGYVITLSLLGDLAAGRFSILAFYERRVRRIFPALIFTFALSWLAAWLLLLPSHFLDFSNSLLSSATFVSNLYFWKNSGYFDNSAQLRPLLHTWSLSVEEQFYLFMPVAVYLIHRYLKMRWALLLVPALLASFALSVFATYTAPTANFFLLPTRAWELLVGAMLAFAHLPAARGRIADGLALAGIGLIAFSVVFYSDATPIPGVGALAPCLGAALLIYTGMHAQTYVGRFLMLGPMVFIGKISYSLYLVHWPIIVFARHAALREPTNLQLVLIALASVGLATFSWAYVERPFRWPKKPVPRAQLLWGGAGAMAFAALIGAAGVLSQGIPGRFGAGVKEAQVEQGTWKTGVCFLLGDPDYRAWNADACRRTSGKAQNALLWGDSFAAHYAPGLVANTSNLTANFFQYTAAGCPPILSYYSYARPHCQAFNAHVFSIIRTHDIKTVVLSARWRDMRTRGFGGLADTIAALKNAGVDVWVIGQSTEFLTDVSAIAQRNGQSGGADAWPLAFDRGLNTKLRQAATGATFVDPLDFLCKGEDCTYSRQGQLIYADYGHFSPMGSARAVLDYFPLIQRTGTQ